jgi:hypothetical protein
MPSYRIRFGAHGQIEQDFPDDESARAEALDIHATQAAAAGHWTLLERLGPAGWWTVLHLEPSRPPLRPLPSEPDELRLRLTLEPPQDPRA